MKRILSPEVPALWGEGDVEVSVQPIDVAAIAAAGRNRTPAPERRSKAWDDIVGTYGYCPPPEDRANGAAENALDAKKQIAAIKAQLKK